MAGVVVAVGALGIAAVSAQQPEPARRMMVLLFDVGSLQPDDLVRVTQSSVKYADDTMAATDLVSVVAVGSRLNVLTDFTSDRAQIKAAIGALSIDAAGATRSSDVLLGGIRTLCESLAPFQQKKAVLFFSGGMSRDGNDNSIEVRAATNTCNRANVSLYPVDARGLVTVAERKTL
jgi:VWFA-related protein